jgi:hypothetical protein
MMAAFTMMDPDRINRSKDSSAEQLTIAVLWVSAIESLEPLSCRMRFSVSPPAFREPLAVIDRA